jgi:hypothetical protein
MEAPKGKHWGQTEGGIQSREEVWGSFGGKWRGRGGGGVGHDRPVINGTAGNGISNWALYWEKL